MQSEPFVQKHSIVREIWGKSDTILLVFAGASAEFALNKAVDWLYFTGKLPADPLGRLFSTVNYAKAIVFSDKEMAKKPLPISIKSMPQLRPNEANKYPNGLIRMCFLCSLIIPFAHTNCWNET